MQIFLMIFPCMSLSDYGIPDKYIFNSSIVYMRTVNLLSSWKEKEQTDSGLKHESVRDVSGHH